jgi:hypothetical protein
MSSKYCDEEEEELPWQKYINFLLWFHYGTEVEDETDSWVDLGPGLPSNVASKTRELYLNKHKNVMFAAIYSVIKKDEGKKFLGQNLKSDFKSIRDLIIINIRRVKNPETKNILESEMYCSKQWKILRRFLMDMLDHIAGPTQCSSASTKHRLDNPAIPTLEDMTNMDDIEEGHYYVCEQSWSAVGMTEPERGPDPEQFKYCHYSGSFNADKIREHELRCSYVRYADQKKIKELEKYMNITGWDTTSQEQGNRTGRSSGPSTGRSPSRSRSRSRSSSPGRGRSHDYDLAEAWKEWKGNLPNKGGELLSDSRINDRIVSKERKKELLEKLQIFFHENSTPIMYHDPPIDVFNRFMKRQTLLKYVQEKTEGKEDCLTKMKNLFKSWLWKPNKKTLSQDYLEKKNYFKSWHHSPKRREILARDKAYGVGYGGGSKKRTRRRNKYRKKSNRKFNKKYSKKRKRKKSKKRRRKRTKRRKRKNRRK